MTDYLEEALEGLDALARRLRRMGTSAADKGENIVYSPDIRRDTGDFREKNRNVSNIGIKVDDTEFRINRSINQVYNLEAAGRTSLWGTDIEEDGGRTSPWRVAIGENGGRAASWGAAMGEDVGRTAPWGAAMGEDVGRTASWGAAAEDSAGSEAILRPAELEEAPAGRAGGRDSAPLPPRGPGAEWIPGEGTEAWAPAGETGASGPPASEEMRWAEQADRAFRRDSRRYDGGFYLY